MHSHLLAIALAATQSSAIAARVGSDAITVGDVVTRAQKAHLKPAAALDDLIREALVAKAARAEGLAGDSRVKARLETERRRLAVDQLIAEDVVAKVKVPEQEVVEEFHARYDEVRISMVVRATDEEARGVQQRLRAGAGIIEEARSSIDPVGRAKSGVMGTFHRGEIAPELARAAFSAGIDQPTGPVRVEKGFAVFVVHERKTGDEATFRRAAPEIRRAIEQSRHEERTDRLVRELRAKQRATVDAAFLESTRDSIDAPRDLLERIVARAAGITVPYREVLRRMKDAIRDSSSVARRATPEMKERVSWRLLDEKLLERTALQRGLERRPAVVAAMRSATRAILARAFAHRVGDDLPPVSDREIEARYREKSEDFWTSPHRMCVVLDARTEDDAKQLRSRLAAGEHVEDVSKEYVDPKGPRHSPEPVPFTDEQLDAMASEQSDQHVFAWTVRQAKTGEWTPVENRGHWHLVRCEAPQPRRRRALDEVKTEIADSIRQKRAAAQVDARIAQLRRVTPVKTYRAALPRDG